MNYKVGIIGAGNIAARYNYNFNGWPVTHCAAFKSNPNTKVTAICDHNINQAKDAKEFFSIPNIYKTHTEMLETEELDIISICTPYEFHASIIEDIVKAKQNTEKNSSIKAIWCEKPFTNNLDKARKIAELCKQNNITLAVNFQRRHDQINQVLKPRLDELLGEVKKVLFMYAGGITNNGSHTFDLLQFYFGKIASVQAIKDEKDNRTDPNLTVHCTFKTGITATIMPCTIEEHSTFELSIIGKKARFDLLNRPFFGYDYRYLPHQKADTISNITVSSTTLENPLPKDLPRDLFVSATQDIVRAIESPNHCLISSAQNAIDVMELISASIYSANHSNQKINLPFTQGFDLPKLQGVYTTWKKQQ